MWAIQKTRRERVDEGENALSDRLTSPDDPCYTHKSILFYAPAHIPKG